MFDDETNLGIVVEGSSTLPVDYPPLGEIVSAKVSAEIIASELLPIRKNILALRGVVHIALTYSTSDAPHSLSFLKLRLPFCYYLPHLTPGKYRADVLYHVVDAQHCRSMYYSVVLKLRRNEWDG